MYTVEYLGNVVGGRPIRYLNAPAATLSDLVLKSLEDGRPVWFGCDVSKQFDRESGLWDARLHDYEAAYGIPLDMTKAQRLQVGHSAMTHAMVFTGVDIVDGRARRYRVENSWGGDKADKGYFTMNESWFAEYVFEIAVPTADLPDDLRACLGRTPRVLPLWDPMGALA